MREIYPSDEIPMVSFCFGLIKHPHLLREDCFSLLPLDRFQVESQITEPPKMSLSKPAVKRKVVDEHRQFREKWGVQYFFVDHRCNPTCVICTEKVAVH